MSETIDGFCYRTEESPFIRWFERAHEIGMDYLEIRNQLQYIEKYYDEISQYGYLKSNIYRLFDMWNESLIH
jgi:hypothetical protein